MIPVRFTHDFVDPVFKCTFVIDDYVIDLCKKQLQVLDKQVLVVEVWTSGQSFVAAAGSDHTFGRAV